MGKGSRNRKHKKKDSNQLSSNSFYNLRYADEIEAMGNPPQIMTENKMDKECTNISTIDGMSLEKSSVNKQYLDELDADIQKDHDFGNMLLSQYPNLVNNVMRLIRLEKDPKYIQKISNGGFTSNEKSLAGGKAEPIGEKRAFEVLNNAIFEQITTTNGKEEEKDEAKAATADLVTIEGQKLKCNDTEEMRDAYEWFKSNCSDYFKFLEWKISLEEKKIPLEHLKLLSNACTSNEKSTKAEAEPFSVRKTFKEHNNKDKKVKEMDPTIERKAKALAADSLKREKNKIENNDSSCYAADIQDCNSDKKILKFPQKAEERQSLEQNSAQRISDNVRPSKKKSSVKAKAEAFQVEKVLMEHNNDTDAHNKTNTLERTSLTVNSEGESHKESGVTLDLEDEAIEENATTTEPDEPKELVTDMQEDFYFELDTAGNKRILVENRHLYYYEQTENIIYCFTDTNVQVSLTGNQVLVSTPNNELEFSVRKLNTADVNNEKTQTDTFL